MIFNFKQKTKETQPVKHKPLIRNIKETRYSVLKEMAYNTQNSVTSIYQTPFWSVYTVLYANIPAIRAAVSKKSNTLLGSGWRIQDRNGITNKKVTQEVQRLINLRDIIQKGSAQYDVYGSVFYTYRQVKNKPKFFLPPASEISNVHVDIDTYTLANFDWNGNGFRSTQKITKDFHLGVIADLDDQLFGSPRLIALRDKLESYLIDHTNYQKYLENGAFPGLFAMTSEAITEETVRELTSQLQSLSDQNMRYSASIIPDALDDEGRPLINFTTIEQKMENRMSEKEKEEINGLVYDALGIPGKVMRQQTQGIGSDEYEIALTDFVTTGVQPQATLLEDDVNAFVLPKTLEYLEKTKWFAKNDIRVPLGKSKTRIATAEDFVFEFNDIDVQTPTKRQSSYNEGYQLGIFSVGTVKEKAYKFRVSEIDPEDYNKTFQDTKPNYNKPNNDIASPNQGQNDLKVDDVKAVSKTLKQSSKIRKSIRKLIQENDNDFSIIEPMLESNKIKDIKEKVKAQLKKQYMSSNVFDIDIDEETKVTDILDQVTFNKTSDALDSGLFTLAALYVGQVAVMVAEQEYNINRSEKHAIRIDIDSFVHQHINNLFGSTDKVDLNTLFDFEVNEKNKEITNPYYEGSLDDTTAQELAAIAVAISQGADFDEEVNKRLENRTNLILDIALASVFGFSMYAVAEHTGAKKKMWLRTRAKNPDPTHLAQVGQVVDIDGVFADGSFWSQSRYGCQCSIKLIK